MKRGDITSWRRDGDMLRPNSPRARSMLDTLEDGQRVPVQFLHDRNMPQLRAYMAMLNRVVAATDRWKSTDDLSFEISLELKSGHPYVDAEGRAHWVPDSRAVSAMPQETFDHLFRDTEAWLIAKLGCHPNDLKVDAS